MRYILSISYYDRYTWHAPCSTPPWGFELLEPNGSKLTHPVHPQPPPTTKRLQEPHHRHIKQKSPWRSLQRRYKKEKKSSQTYEDNNLHFPHSGAKKTNLTKAKEAAIAKDKMNLPNTLTLGKKCKTKVPTPMPVKNQPPKSNTTFRINFLLPFLLFLNKLNVPVYNPTSVSHTTDKT